MSMCRHSAGVPTATRRHDAHVSSAPRRMSTCRSRLKISSRALSGRADQSLVVAGGVGSVVLGAGGSSSRESVRRRRRYFSSILKK
jgi:hypothetical protein